MTALHLAAKFGHTNVLMVLEDKVPWTSVSTKVYVILLSDAMCNCLLAVARFSVTFVRVFIETAIKTSSYIITF